MRKALVILGTLDDSDVEWMIATGKRERIAAGSMLIQEGRSSDHLYVVVGGAFAVRSGALQGKEIAELRIGEMVGEMSFVDARPPSASVVALEDSLVLSIPVAALRDRLNDPPFAARFYRALGGFSRRSIAQHRHVARLRAGFHRSGASGYGRRDRADHAGDFGAGGGAPRLDDETAAWRRTRPGLSAAQEKIKMPEEPGKAISRKQALEKWMSSPDRLDQLIRIVSPKDWFLLAILLTLGAVSIAWCIWGQLPTTVSGRGNHHPAEQNRGDSIAGSRQAG